MISIGYYENDGKIYVFAIFDGVATRAHLATEGLVQALMDAESLEIAAERLKAWIPSAHDPVVLANHAEARLRALASKYPDVEKIEAPQPETSNPNLKASSFKGKIIAWPRYSILTIGRIFSDMKQLSEFGGFVREFAAKTSDNFEVEVKARFQADGPLEPGM